MAILPAHILIILLPLQALGRPTTPEALNTSSNDHSGWYKEAVIGLVAAVIALFTLPLAFGRIRRWIASSIKSCWALPSTRKFFRHYGPDPATEDLLRRADEWIQFRRWCEFVEGRSAD